MKVKVVTNIEKLPEYKTNGAACCDVYCQETITIKPHTTVILPTEMYVAVPIGYKLMVYCRSGLSVQGIQVANGPGIVDCDYRTKKVGVILYNSSDNDITIKKDDCMAQFGLEPAPIIDNVSLFEFIFYKFRQIINPSPRIEWVIVNELPLVKTNRKGGYGSTNKIEKVA